MVTPKQKQKGKFHPSQSNLAQITPKNTLKIRVKVQN